MTHPKPSAENITEISRRNGYVAKPLYVMETSPCGELELIFATLERHLKYWVDLEKKNVLFAGGPFLPVDANGELTGIGMVIFRANSVAEAMEIAAQDPMHVVGARKFVVTPWLLNHFNGDGLM